MFFIAPLSPDHFCSHQRLTWEKRKRNTVCASASDVDVAVVGGGVAGLAAARALQKVGRSPMVFEKSAPEAPTGQAIGLWTNAWRALDALDADTSHLRDACIRNQNVRIIAAASNKKIASMRIPDDCEFRYVPRAELLGVLSDGVADIRYDAAVKKVRTDGSGGNVQLVLDDGSVVSCGAVLGADGVRSIVREACGLPMETSTASYHAWRGSANVKDVRDIELEKGEVLQIWGKAERFGATFVDENTVHWFYTRTSTIHNLQSDRNTELDYVRKCVAKWTATPVASQIAELPQLDFTVTRCGDRLPFLPNYSNHAVTLLGDAAHLSTPNLGQGAALALEDAVVLAHFMSSSVGAQDDISAMRQYERTRWARVMNVGIRSAAVGVLVHQSMPLFTTIRDRLVAPLTTRPSVLLQTTHWRAPSTPV